MTEKQYRKFESKLGFRNCPICGASYVIYCGYNRVNLFGDPKSPTLFEEVEIPNNEYVELECHRCSFVMKFNIKKILE